MTRAKAAKLYRTFVKGLITEAGFLTYPEDASVDELNTVIHRKGNRTRRLGMEIEPGEAPLSLHLPGHWSDAVTCEYLWKSVANKAEINFLCIQVDHKIYFMDTSVTPVVQGRKAFEIDLSLYKAPTATLEQLKNTHVHMSSGKGWLFVAGQYMDPLSVEYDPDTDTIAVSRVVIQIRDFDGVNDGLANDQEPPTLSQEHRYNLMNQGWVTPGTPSASSSGGGSGGGGGSTVTYDPYTGEEVTYDRYGNSAEIP